MNQDFKEAWLSVKESIKLFGWQHWAFVICVVIPFALVAAPFYLVSLISGGIARGIGAMVGFFSLMLPDYPKSK